MIVKSYGGMTEILEFLDSIEQLKMQGLSVWMYTIGVGRVQTKYERGNKVYYFADLDGDVTAIEESPLNSSGLCSSLE